VRSSACCKFLGRQSIIFSRKLGITKVQPQEYQRLKAERRVLTYVLRLRSRWRWMLTRLFSDSVCIHHIRPCGPLEANIRVHHPV
jgi:hypothetical protein